jgi:thioredoxin
MAGILTLTDADWQATLGNRPALVLFTTGDGLRGDFTTAFRKAAAENNRLVFGQVHPTQNPQLAARFEVSDKPVLVGLLNGEARVRRPRPWGSDVVLAVELMESLMSEQNEDVMEESPMNDKKNVAAQDKPVIVTEQTFKQEVIDYSHELPVLVDFWAEWCGPCRMVAPIMEKLAKDYAGQIRVAKVDTDANQGIAQAFRIMSIPTIMAFKDGQLVFNQAGAFPEAAFRDLVKQLIALDVQAAIRNQQNPR